MIKYKVTLTKSEYEQLMDIVNKGIHSSQQYRTAYVLLNCDEGKYGEKLTRNEISRVLKTSMRMIDRIKQRFVKDKFEACLERKPMSNTKLPKIDGDKEAHLIALSCSKAPEGFAKWSLRMLADKMIELKHVEHISYETIRNVLKKTS